MTTQCGFRPKEILIVAHTGRDENVVATRDAVAALREAGVKTWLLADERHDVGLSSSVEILDEDNVPDSLDFVFVLGGDGTILRAAELSRARGVPLLGVNLGSVGFLADREREDLPHVIQDVVAGEFETEKRMVLDVCVSRSDGTQSRSWAINEASVEKADRSRVIELVTEVDGRPVSSFGGDGVVLATPTGSTAYAFSAGGPVVWPDVEALLMVPICGHALFAKPLVTAPDSALAVEVLGPAGGGVLWCDGRRRFDVLPGDRIEVCRSATPLVLARLSAGPFTDRLVAKFRLPVVGWRGPHSERP